MAAVCFVLGGNMTKTYETVLLSKLIPYANNPRKNDDAVPAVEASIEQVGYITPIVVDENYEVLAGHTRLKALNAMGTKEAEVLIVDGLTDEEKRKYRILDNKTGDFAEWDVDLLELELADLDFGDFDFGFDIETEEPAEVVDDNYEPTNVEARCKLGDIWQLGNHRLICGDSTDADVISVLMQNKKADISFTSPPYNVGESAVLDGNTHMTDCKYQSGDDNLADYDELLIGTTDNMLMFSKWAFVNLQMLANNKRILCEWLDKYKDCLCDIAIWYKNATAPAMAKRVMNSQFEFIFIFSNDNNSRAIGTKDFRGTVSNVYAGSAQRNNEYSDVHSVTFPIEFASHFIESFTNKGDSVLDVFGGTGTTMIVCEQIGRRCYMSEIDEKYCDIIIDRWENFTGKKAVLLNGTA